VSHEPPVTISIQWCSTCGGHDRARPFTGKSHWTNGERCTGQAERVVYEHPYRPAAPPVDAPAQEKEPGT
jgi:hypothetical protein